MSGTGNFSGNLYAGSCGAELLCDDIAELYDAELHIETADVVCINNKNKADYCNGNDDVVLGIVSTSPAIVIEGSQIVMGRGNYSGSRPIALKGRVPVKADCATPIAKGDMLVPSEKKGHAMSHRALEAEDYNSILRLINNNLGKALEGCDEKNSVIQAWVD